MISLELLCHCQHTSSRLLAALISWRSSSSSSIFWSCCLLRGAVPLSLSHPQNYVSLQISLSSELQPSSIPADESSSDMLVIVDEPMSSAPQSRATNSPVSIAGSVSDTMNGGYPRLTQFFICLMYITASLVILHIQFSSNFIQCYALSKVGKAQGIHADV